ncbi:hypothetical protein B0T16DRAFT_414410 [Cercophora newfieldiana]|uniref:Uncharacterized protein n=1 Tax=Cercophora newfieldiana TaxID=92897 RepID=A0AA39Y6D5_9PEZI|nr:hypothetical protein B0T16DRAFT_414410 [Cercophora newfieldiana]
MRLTRSLPYLLFARAAIAQTLAEMPSFCTTVVTDLAKTTVYTSTQSCFTRTISICDKTCRPAGGGGCRQVFWGKDIPVSCATQCCPTTQTVTVRDCEVSCEEIRCPPPLGTATVTYGCSYRAGATSPTGYRTLTKSAPTTRTSTSARVASATLVTSTVVTVETVAGI